MKKKHISSPLELLPLHQKQQLFAWLTTGGPHRNGMTYKEAQGRVLSEFGLKVSQMALSSFYHRHVRKAAPTIETTFESNNNVFTAVIHIHIHQLTK
jgi:hypothetical protein